MSNTRLSIRSEGGVREIRIRINVRGLGIKVRYRLRLTKPLSEGGLHLDLRLVECDAKLRFRFV